MAMYPRPEKNGPRGHPVICLFTALILTVTLQAATFAESRKGKVAKVISGNTIRLSSGETVRYIGVGLPEERGKEALAAAREYNRALVEGKEIIYTYGVQRHDTDGAAMAYVIAGNIFVNAALIAEGYAYAELYPPELRYAKEFVELQHYAEQHRLGIWKDKASDAGRAPRERGDTGRRPDGETQGTNIPQQPEKAAERYASHSISQQHGGRRETGRRVEYSSPSLQAEQGNRGYLYRRQREIPIEVFVSQAADAFIKKYILKE